MNTALWFSMQYVNHIRYQVLAVKSWPATWILQLHKTSRTLCLFPVVVFFFSCIVFMILFVFFLNSVWIWTLMNSRSKWVQWALAAVPQEKAGSADCYWSNNRLLAQKTSHIHYPESSKVLASPCFFPLRITERWQVVSPECFTGKLSGYENEKSLGSVLWASGAQGPEHHCSKAAEVCHNVCLCEAHLSGQHKQRGWQQMWQLDVPVWSACSLLHVPPDHTGMYNNAWQWETAKVQPEQG